MRDLIMLALAGAVLYVAMRKPDADGAQRSVGNGGKSSKGDTLDRLLDAAERGVDLGEKIADSKLGAKLGIWSAGRGSKRHEGGQTPAKAAP